MLFSVIIFGQVGDARKTKPENKIEKQNRKINSGKKVFCPEFGFSLQYLLRTAIAEPMMPAMITSSNPNPDLVGIAEGVGAGVSGVPLGSGGTGVASVTVCVGAAVAAAV